MGQRKQQHDLAKKQKKPSTPNKNLTFLEHIYELRTRLFWVVFALVVASAIGFQFKDQLISLVMAPLHGQKLIYLTPGGGFSFIFTISIYFGALLCIPIAVYHMYRFMEPLLGGTSRKVVAAFIIISAFLATAGASFGYFVTVPAAIDFLATFAGNAVVPSLTAESYLSFVVTYIFGLAALFQIPLLLFIFDYVRPLPPKALLSAQRYVIIAATVLAAIITPTPDALNMAIVAIPIIAVYEVGAIAVYIRHRVGGKRYVVGRNTLDGDEPLTAIIEELERSHSEKEQVRQPDFEEDMEFAFDDELDVFADEAYEPVAPAAELNETKPVVATANVAPVQIVSSPVRRSAMDGMVRGRAQPVAIRPPARNVQPARMPQRPTIQSRPMRSVDGFSMMSRA
ncbi:MAG: twin-arginine translocase subunit TatC [Candidatus Nomurabacteria bacterium]|nr:MAG: twin-arginine translocase subunit TatC [Candidatus Nomurabacteria bacterium]